MPLFQTSVLKKYIKGLDQSKVNKAWEQYQKHFHNPTIQENIREAKEEQYQAIAIDVKTIRTGSTQPCMMTLANEQGQAIGEYVVKVFRPTHLQQAPTKKYMVVFWLLLSICLRPKQYWRKSLKPLLIF